MANVLVRNLPDNVHEALRMRAQRQGLSLQQYLSEELRRLVERPSRAEVLDAIDRRRGGAVGLAQAVEDLEAARSGS